MGRTREGCGGGEAVEMMLTTTAMVATTREF
jgi:hypothetical protein